MPCSIEPEVSVKNTFISLGHPQPRSVLRSSSLPPSMRVAGGKLADEDGLEGVRRDWASNQDVWSRSSRLPCADRVLSEVSTEADTSEGCLSATGETPSETEHDSENTQLNGLQGSSRPQKQKTVEQLLMCTSSPQQMPSRLNAGARPFSPGLSVGVLSSDVKKQFHSVVASCAAALGSATGVWDGASVAENANGLSVTAHIHPKDLYYLRERLLARAKDALLGAAAKSGNIYIMGYCWRPFVATPLGFSAMLIAIDDPDKACWGMLKHGSCRYGNACRWEHSTNRANVHVMIKVAEV